MTIEDGIPIPPAIYGRKPTACNAEMRQLEIGQSRFCTEMQEIKTGRAILGQMGRKCVVRAGVKDGVTGWRLWRTS